MKAIHFARVLGTAILCLAMLCLLGAATCHQPFGPFVTGSGPTHKQHSAFGDSLAAGYKHTGLFPGQIKSYVGYYADLAANDRDWTVTYQGMTTTGATTPQINNRMRSINGLKLLREAEILTWDAGPNDFLAARHDYRGNCNESALQNRFDSWRTHWDALVDTVRDNAGMDAGSAPMIRATNIYYPNPDHDRTKACAGQRSHFEVFLPLLLSAGDYMCSSAEANGWRCADSIAAMNCKEDAEGNPDPRCPNKRYLQHLVNSGTCPRVATAQFDHPVLDPTCIRDHLDATGDWGEIRDPRSVSKNGATVNLIQNDGKHPNAAGHIRIAEAHDETGYDDVEGPLVEDNYALCIDNQDNDGDGDLDCVDSDCSPYCGS